MDSKNGRLVPIGHAMSPITSSSLPPLGVKMVAVPIHQRTPAGKATLAAFADSRTPVLPKGSTPLVVTPTMTPQSHNALSVYRKRPSTSSVAELSLAANIIKQGRKTTEKAGKGLRHFSTKVCEKVQQKGITTYNEVADELVEEFSNPRHVNATDQQYDQKNIRRRVYDALNVLMAINIISKAKKEIRWIGLPTNSAQECQNLEREKVARLERIRMKQEQLKELILQQVAFRNLVERNRQREANVGAPPSGIMGDNSRMCAGGPDGVAIAGTEGCIQLPFIIVNTSKKTVIDCNISSDKYEYLFKFNNTFQIHDDIEVLKRMGLAYGLEKGQCTAEGLAKVRSMLPTSLQACAEQLCGGANTAIATSSMSMSGAIAASGGLHMGGGGSMHMSGGGGVCSSEDSNPATSVASSEGTGKRIRQQSRGVAPKSRKVGGASVGKGGSYRAGNQSGGRGRKSGSGKREMVQMEDTDDDDEDDDDDDDDDVDDDGY